MKLVFVHGWGFDAKIWQDVIQHLPEHDCVCADLGYFGPQHRPETHGAVIVGHSLGFPWALENFEPKGWKAAIAVNSFTRFARAADFAHGQMPKILDRMIAKFDQSPLLVAQDFLTRCGADWQGWPDSFDQNALKSGLNWLREMDQRDHFSAQNWPCLALCGTDDPIVSLAMSQDCFGRHGGLQLKLMDKAQHILPQSHPQWVATLIKEFLAGLS